MDDETRLREAVDVEEARRAARIAREGEPDVRGVDDRRLLSGLAEVAFASSPETADAVAEALDDFAFDVATRAIKLARTPDEVVDLATRLAEADRLSTLRVRAATGDEGAAKELAAAREAMRRAVR